VSCRIQTSKLNSVKVCFRTDSSINIGTGHVMRCLTLAEALRKRGAECCFVCRDHPGNLLELISGQGFPAFVLPLKAADTYQPLPPKESAVSPVDWLGVVWISDAEATKVVLDARRVDWLIVDHYALDVRWETALRSHCHKLMVIDDLADRQHDCDLLLDQNFYVDMATRYHGLVPDTCVTLLGPAYALLRAEFIQKRREMRARDGVVRRILVFFGGSDSKRQTEKTIHALMRLDLSGIEVDVVIGQSNPCRERLQKLCKLNTKFTLHCQVLNMADLIHNADLGVGAGGTAMWERCYLGLPTITVIASNNQLCTTQDVAARGAIVNLGYCDVLSVDDYQSAIGALVATPDRVKWIADAAVAIVPPVRASVADRLFNLMGR